MSHRSTISCARCRRGVTLIEALAGLVILGTLLAGVTTARWRANQQYKDAERRLAATRALDALMAEWHASPTATVPLNTGGVLSQSPRLLWRTTTRLEPSAKSLHALVAKVEVFDAVSPSRVPLLSIELLVPEPRSTTQPATRPGGER